MVNHGSVSSRDKYVTIGEVQQARLEVWTNAVAAKLQAKPAAAMRKGKLESLLDPANDLQGDITSPTCQG